MFARVTQYLTPSPAPQAFTSPHEHFRCQVAVKLENLETPAKRAAEKPAPDDASAQVAKLPNLRLISPGKSLVPSEVSPPKKYCAFLCGAECGVSPDPVDGSRTAIRWAYDKADPADSGTAGANDWHCERAWVQVAHTHVDRDRTKYQQTCALDKDELTRFLEKRQAGIDKLKSRHGHEKRRGAKIKRATWQHTLNRSTTLLTSQHLWTKHQAPSRNSN